MKAKIQLLSCILMLTPIASFASIQDYINDSAQKGVVIEEIYSPSITHLNIDEVERVIALVRVNEDGVTNVVDVKTQNNDLRYEILESVKRWRFEPKQDTYLVKIPFVVKNN